MAEKTGADAVREGAPSFKDTLRETLTSGERIIAKFHPHPVSFIRWYVPAILLMLWTAFYLVIVFFMPGLVQAIRNILGPYSGLAVLVLWAIGAVLIGFVLPRNPRTSKANVTAASFLKAVQVVYFILVILPVVLFFLLEARTPGTDYSTLIYLYTLAVSLLILLIYNLYRLSFTYFITNFRVIFRYKFFKTAENNLRFSQIRDVEVDRTLLQRIFKLGNVRPYTGAEENLVDLTPGYDSPDECFFGVRNPEYVKRILLEQMLGPQDHTQDAHARTDAPPRQGGARAPAAAAPAAPAASAGADTERVRRLEEELEELRGSKALAASPPQAPPAPAEAPGAAAEPLRPAPEPVRGRLSQVTPTSDVREVQRKHAEFGDDRDALHPSDADFRGAPERPKKPVPPGTPADEDDKPRSI